MQPFEQSPYWKTLQPIIESGAIQAAIDGVYKYPYRINLYPGTSCMFECLYCGRNYDAVIKKSENVYKQIIEQDDGKDKNRFGITGGLEPLTSPYINQITKDLFDGGYRARMITNGFLLNEKVLGKNPYINSLDHIRVSLYGLDESEYLTTTKHIAKEVIYYTHIDEGVGTRGRCEFPLWYACVYYMCMGKRYRHQCSV